MQEEDQFKSLEMYHNRYITMFANLTCTGGTDAEIKHCLERLTQVVKMQNDLVNVIKMEIELEGPSSAADAHTESPTTGTEDSSTAEATVEEEEQTAPERPDKVHEPIAKRKEAE